MAGNGLRIGFVSSYNAAAGMASVYYPDRMGEVTGELPVFSPCGLVQVLQKGDAVLVHSSMKALGTRLTPEEVIAALQ